MSKELKLTVVFGFRNRDLERVRRCLDSLGQQTFQDFEVLFVDYGSEPTIAAMVKSLTESYEFCRYLYSDTRGYPWNRSRALNIGCRRAASDFVMTTDVDMIYPTGFLKTYIEHLAPDRVLYCFSHYLPEAFSDWDNLEKYTGKLPVAGNTALGASQCTSATVLEKIRGFDEYYCYWGIEDRDINHRLKLVGLDEVWLNGQTEMFHQWHPPVDVKTAGFMPEGLWGRMQTHYFRCLGSIQRNDHDWGRIHLPADRPVFRFLDFVEGRLVENANLHVFEGNLTDNRAVGAFVRQFWELEPGEALVIPGSQFPQRFGWTDRLIRALNRGLRMLDTDSRIDYAPNRVHAYMDEFIEQARNEVADYYLGFPFQNGVSILLKGG